MSVLLEMPTVPLISGVVAYKVNKTLQSGSRIHRLFGKLVLFDKLTGRLCMGKKESEKGEVEGSIRAKSLFRPISIASQVESRIRFNRASFRPTNAG